VKQSATLNYRLERSAGVLFALAGAGLAGWAVALALGLWGDRMAARLTPWKPFELAAVRLDAGPASATPVAVAASRLVGVAGDRAYFVTGAAPNLRYLSLAAGDALPSGERVTRIARDAVFIASATGEVRVPVLPDRAPAAVAAVPGAQVAGCRLTGADRAAAIFLQPAVVKALAAERATFARMFEPLVGSAGIRAKGTGGTTAMFAIEDGDVLLRADGVALKGGEAIATEILARLDRGASVAVDGERKGTPRRWVYAPSSCNSSSSNMPSSSASKASG